MSHRAPDNKPVIWVLDNPAAPPVQYLDGMSELGTAIVGHEPESFADAAAADVILSWFSTPGVLRHACRMAPGVRWIHSISAGLEHVLVPEVVASPAPLTNARGVFSDSLGEFVIASALYFAKKFREMERNQKAGTWTVIEVEDVAGSTLGIVGYGDIGRAIARRAKAMDMNVLALRRRTGLSSGDPWVDEVVSPSSIQSLMSRSDYVVAATPLTDETRGLIGEAEIRAMKTSAVIMNVGRGPVIDETALIRALQQSRIRGAALDVFDREPLPENHPFYRLENVLLSPHSADRTPGWLGKAANLFLRNLEKFRRGEQLENVIDKSVGY